MNETDEKMNEGRRSVREGLPELSEEEIVDAESEDNLQWANDFVTYNTIGYYHFIGDFGVGMQVVSRTAVRCVSVWDDAFCYHKLAMLERTFERAGYEIQIDPYAVIRPHVPADAPKYAKAGKADSDVTGAEAASARSCDELAMEVA